MPASFSYVTSILNQVEEYARKNAISTIIQLGDVHDSTHVDEQTRLFFMQSLQRSKLRWIMYYGNHDYLSAEYNTLQYYRQMQSTFGILPNAKFITEPTIMKIEKQNCAVLPWPHATITSKESLLCFAHFAKFGAKSDNGFVLKTGENIDTKHFWIIGDLHSYQKGDNYLYVGAPLQLKYGDTDKRYFVNFTGSSNKPKWQRIQIKLPYILEQQTILQISNIEKLQKHLSNRSDNTYTKIKCGADIMADYRFEEIQSTKNIIIEYAGKVKATSNDNENVAIIDSKSVRQQLVRKRLIKKGFDKLAISKAIHILNQIEAGI